jgi:hypothetical protein
MTLNIPLARWPFVLKAALPLISRIRLAFTAFGPPVFLETAAFFGELYLSSLVVGKSLRQGGNTFIDFQAAL